MAICHVLALLLCDCVICGRIRPGQLSFFVVLSSVDKCVVPPFSSRVQLSVQLTRTHPPLSFISLCFRAVTLVVPKNTPKENGRKKWKKSSEGFACAKCGKTYT